MHLQELRDEVDRLDQEIILRILQRRELGRKAAEYKVEHQIPIFARDREQQILDQIANQLGTDQVAHSVQLIYGILMDLTKLYEYQLAPKTFDIPTTVGGASVRAILPDRPGVLTRYIAPLAVSQISISKITTQAMPGGKMAVDIEMVGKVQDPDFAAVLSVLSDTAEQFVLL